jgi:hypothetical protein
MILATTFVSLLALPAACGEEAPTRPDDGSVPAWESCQWEGQNLFELCESDLVCSSRGVCTPSCQADEDCPQFAGFESECGYQDGMSICEVRCDGSSLCPMLDGVALECMGGYCVGSSQT